MSKELQDQVEKAVARAKNVKATRSDPNCACPSCLDASVILAMAAEVERLRRLCERACKVGDGLVDLAAPGLDTFRDVAITDIAEIREELSHE